MHLPVPSYSLGPNIMLSIVSTNAVKLCASLWVTDQVSSPNKTTDKIVVLKNLGRAKLFFEVHFLHSLRWAAVNSPLKPQAEGSHSFRRLRRSFAICPSHR
jgi:hypothetical protein